jgi:hypothetical protein
MNGIYKINGEWHFDDNDDEIIKIGDLFITGYHWPEYVNDNWGYYENLLFSIIEHKDIYCISKVEAIL